MRKFFRASEPREMARAGIAPDKRAVWHRNRRSRGGGAGSVWNCSNRERLLSAAGNLQVVTPNPLVQTAAAGDTVDIGVEYATDPSDATLTGLGLRMHFDSSALTFAGLSDVLATGLVQQQVQDDAADFDGDPATDRFVLIAWQDFAAGQWPGQIPATLFTAEFLASPTAAGSTAVHFTSSSTAAGWTLDATSATVDFLAANDPPAANADSFATDEDTPLLVGAPGVLANDTDLDGNSLSAVLVGEPLHGSLTFGADGSFTYAPDADFHGNDSFTYRAHDGRDGSASAMVAITVRPVNDPPTAAGDRYSTQQNTPLVVAAPGVLANDADVDGDPLSAALVDGPAHGSVTLDPDGSFTYTPAADFAGSDSFTYAANDGAADSIPTTVTIGVGLDNRPPVAADDHYATGENTAMAIDAPGVLANDSDLDGDPLNAVLVDGPLHGSLELGDDGSLIYTPEANFIGDDSFTYKADDAIDDSNVAAVTITVGNSLGPIDFVELGGLDPAGGELRYRFETSRGGFVTLEAQAGNVAVTLYDADHQELATSALVGGKQRIDWQAGGPGETYYFKLAGGTSEVTLRLANLVRQAGSAVAVHGSDGADQFRLDVETARVVTIDGIVYTFDASQAGSVSFDGGPGADTALVHATPGDETAEIRPTSAFLSGADLDVRIVDAAEITLFGNGGHDVVVLHDSAGADHFVGTPTYAAMNGANYYNRAWNFAEAKAEADGGGSDEAKFFDSPGNDTYLATPDSSVFSGTAYRSEAWFFDGVHVYATAGGFDEANLYDSPGNDNFVTTPVYAAMFGDGFYNRAKFFESTNAFATVGGIDIAKMFDSPASDEFVATPTYAAMFNATYQEQYAHGFYHRAASSRGCMPTRRPWATTWT